VEDQTEKKITNLIPAGMINDLTVMILVNAIYFKGSWTHPFKEANTRKSQFYIGTKTSVDIDMMHLTGDKKLRSGMFDELDCKLVELPYGDKKMSMTILLPNKRDGLSALEAKLTPELLAMAVKHLSGRFMLRLALPKFRLEYEFTVNGVLQALGMNNVFIEVKADLSGLDGTKNLYISQVIHKAFIDVNELGTEAAAATGIGIELMSMPMPLEVNCDHPFMFIIKDISGSVLFMGRFMKPA